MADKDAIPQAIVIAVIRHPDNIGTVEYNMSL